MKIENAYETIASEDLIKNDPVVINNGICYRASTQNIDPSIDFYSQVYFVIHPASKGERVLLSGKDTIFSIELDGNKITDSKPVIKLITDKCN